MPTISIKWGKTPKWMYEAAQLLGMDGVPKFSVKWNAEGGIFDKPTILPSLAGWQGVGEAGAEAIAPISLLQEYIRTAVRNENENIGRIMIEQVGILIDFLTRNMPKSVLLDTGVLAGELTPVIDIQLSDRWNHSRRGNTR